MSDEPTTSPPGRSYGDGCAAAGALDVIGERWALLIARELMFGPKRFGDLAAGLPNIRPNVLTQRLRDLEAAAVLRRRRLGPPASAWVYELTDWGHALEPVLVELARWGHGSPFREPKAPVSVDSMMLALRTLFDPRRAGDLAATIALETDGERFTIRVADGQLMITGDPAPNPTARVQTETATLRALLLDGESLSDAERARRVRITGDRSAVTNLLNAVRQTA